MRKRNILEIFDVIMWQLIGLLPILLSLFMSKHFEINFEVYIMDFFSNVDMSQNAFYIVLDGIFGAGYNIACSRSIILCVSFYATVQCMHLVVDVLLFIPHFCQRVMFKGSRG